MKILHIMLSCFYVEGLGYQENMLPLYHRLAGHNVEILTSTFANTYLGDKRYLDKNDYINDYGIHVIKLEKKYTKFLPHKYFFNSYKGVYEAIIDFSPDIVFVHGLTSLANYQISRYLKKHKDVKGFADQHGDYYNAPIDSFANKVLLSVVWKPAIKHLDKYIIRYWGTTPWRCSYLKDVYGLDENKIRLLVMGAHTLKINFNNRAEIRSSIRGKYELKNSDFVVVTGGKIDKTKNIHLLMEAINEICDPNIKLLCFGNCSDEMKDLIHKLSLSDKIRFIGWIESDKVYDLFLASDLCCFPGTHSVLWEQACGAGLPGIFKNWVGMQHIDLGGNCFLLNDVNVENLKNTILKIYEDKNLFSSMKHNAETKCIDYFSYETIAKRAIEI